MRRWRRRQWSGRWGWRRPQRPRRPRRSWRRWLWGRGAGGGGAAHWCGNAAALRLGLCPQVVHRPQPVAAAVQGGRAPGAGAAGVQRESPLLDSLVKLGVGLGGGVSTSVDGFLHRESGAHREEYRPPSVRRSASSAGGSSAGRSSAGAPPGGIVALLDPPGWGPTAKGTAVGVQSLEAEAELVLAPSYIRIASVSPLTVLHLYANAGQYVGGGDAGVPLALRHVLRFLPTLRHVHLADAGVAVVSARYNPGELAALLLRHFATNGLAQQIGRAHV